MRTVMNASHNPPAMRREMNEESDERLEPIVGRLLAPVIMPKDDSWRDYLLIEDLEP